MGVTHKVNIRKSIISGKVEMSLMDQRKMTEIKKYTNTLKYPTIPTFGNNLVFLYFIFPISS